MCHVGFVRRSRGAESLRIDERDLTGYSIPISQLLNASSSLSDIVVCFSSHISLSLCYLAPSQSQLRPGDTTQALPPFFDNYFARRVPHVIPSSTSVRLCLRTLLRAVGSRWLWRNYYPFRRIKHLTQTPRLTTTQPG